MDENLLDDSILLSTKKLLGIPEEVPSFDSEIAMNINSAIAILTQLGVGPQEGFFITSSDDTYSDFLGPQTKMFQHVRMYFYFKTRLGFDPPSSSFVLDSLKEQIKELEYRMKVLSEDLKDQGGENSK